MADGHFGASGVLVQSRVILGSELVYEVVPARNQHTVGTSVMASMNFRRNAITSVAKVKGQIFKLYSPWYFCINNQGPLVYLI